MDTRTYGKDIKAQDTSEPLDRNNKGHQNHTLLKSGTILCVCVRVRARVCLFVCLLLSRCCFRLNEGDSCVYLQKYAVVHISCIASADVHVILDIFT